MKTVCIKLLIVFVFSLMMFVPSSLWAQDLVIKSVQGIPGNPLWNDPVPLLTVVVENKGTAPAAPLMISVTCKRTDNGSSSPGPVSYSQNWPTYYQPPLQPGQTKVFKQNLWPGASNGRFELGKYQLTVVVDPKKKVIESNENNNEATFNFEVKYGTVSNIFLSCVPINYTGSCPKNHLQIAKGTIKAVKGSGIIRYHWLTSFDEPGKQPHIYEMRLKEGESFENGVVTVAQGNYSGWVQLKITYPKVMISNKANFEIKCVNFTYLKKMMPPKLILTPKIKFKK